MRPEKLKSHEVRRLVSLVWERLGVGVGLG